MFVAKRKLVESRDFKHFYKYIIFTSEGEDKVPLDNIAKRAEVYKPKERVTYKKGIIYKSYQMMKIEIMQ